MSTFVNLYYFFILDPFTRVFRGLLLVIKGTFLLLFVQNYSFLCLGGYLKYSHVSTPSPVPKLSTGSKVIHRLSTGPLSKTWHTSCMLELSTGYPQGTKLAWFLHSLRYSQDQWESLGIFMELMALKLARFLHRFSVWKHEG